MIRWILISLALTIASASVMCYVGFARTDLLLEKIPTHWDINMKADAWTTPDAYAKYLLISPGVMLLMVVLMVVLPWLSPKNFEIDRFANTFGFIMTSLVVYFGYMSGLILWAGIEETPPHWGKCFIAGVFALFAVLGIMMGKIQRNFWMGIRTPWTLASEAVWVRTHRVAAWLWGGAGIGGGVAVLVGAPIWVGLIAIFVAALTPALYSLILYKSLEKQGKL